MQISAEPTTRSAPCSAWPRPRPTGSAPGGLGRAGAAAKFIEGILGDLRRAGLVRTQRGVGGGYSLSRPAGEITLGAVLRAVDGPLAEVHGLRPDETSYSGVAVHLRDVWVAVRAGLREVLDQTTVEQVLTGELPPRVRALVELPEAWPPR